MRNGMDFHGQCVICDGCGKYYAMRLRIRRVMAVGIHTRGDWHLAMTAIWGGAECRVLDEKFSVFNVFFLTCLVTRDVSVDSVRWKCFF